MKDKRLSCLAVAGALIFSLVIFSGCTAQDPDYTESHLDMEILDAEARDEDPDGFPPGEEENEFLYIQVEVKNPEGEDTLPLNPFNFELISDEGTEYGHADHEDRPPNLPDGTTASFRLIFEIPEEEIGETLIFEPERLEGDPLTADVPSY